MKKLVTKRNNAIKKLPKKSIQRASLLMTSFIATALCLQTVTAQTTWNLGGNDNTTTASKLGTTRAKPLRLITKNTTRIYIDPATGNVGIGTGDTAADSNYKLQVNGGVYGVYSSGSSYGLYGNGNTGVYGNGIMYGLSGYSLNNTGAFGFSNYGYGVQGISGNTGVYGNGESYGVYAVSSQYGVFANSSSTGVYGQGVGYGIYGYSNSGYGVSGWSDNYDGGYFHSENSYGLRAATINGFYAGVFDGSVFTFGGYYSSSDKNLKKNIQDLDDAISIINKLKPKNYEFRTDEKFASLNLPKGKHYGLIAQDVEEVLPGLVKETPQVISGTGNAIQPVPFNTKEPAKANQSLVTKAEPAGKEVMNIKGVNYEELIPIMIKGMQELSQQNENLQKQVDALKAALLANEKNNRIISSGGASLEQNMPNPFDHTTTINYTLPQSFTSAKIIVTDNSGKVLKATNLTGNGKGILQLDIPAHASGTYTYSLYVNGKLIDTKQMVAAK